MEGQDVSKYDYGECEICHTPMQAKTIKQDFWIRNRLIVVEGVPSINLAELVG